MVIQPAWAPPAPTPTGNQAVIAAHQHELFGMPDAIPDAMPNPTDALEVAIEKCWKVQKEMRPNLPIYSVVKEIQMPCKI